MFLKLSGEGDEATILHADLDAFYASVEQRLDPSLRGKPVIVGGGVVLAASYEARKFGVHSAMNGRRARALCPDAVVVSPHMAEYGRVSKQVMDLFREFTPLVEPLSADEAFLDVSGARRLFGPPGDIAERLRARVREETGLAVSVGVARTKFLAKVASGVAKPDGLVEVPPERELDFLHPLPVERLWGVGPATLERLRSRGVVTVGDLAALPPETVVHIVGKALGGHLHALGWNHDPRDVDPHQGRRSVGSQSALGRSVDTLDGVDRVLLTLADRVASRLRKHDVVGRTVNVRIRFGDSRDNITRARSLRAPTQATDAIYGVAADLVHGVLGADAPAAEDELEADPHVVGRRATVLERRGVSLLGISVSNVVEPDALQLELPLPGVGWGPGDHGGTASSRGALDLAVDAVRERFGRDAVKQAALVDQGQPLAPSWADLDPLAPTGEQADRA